MKKNLNYLCSTLIFLIFPTINLINIQYSNNFLNENLYNYEKSVDDSLFTIKVNAVKNYMEASAISQAYSPYDIELSPELLVEISTEKNFDLPLLLAQAHLESCFGLSSRAKKTNSVFSVGSYENGTNMCIYENQNDSVLPYIELIQKNYLPGKTVSELLQDGSFVDVNNQRYARDSIYEYKISFLRDRIIKKHPELIL